MATTSSNYYNNTNNNILSSNYASHYNKYNQRFTPPTSRTPPSSNVSPTQVHMPHKQIFQPRQCGYVPAALRPTEMPVKRRPNTPPRSAHSSLDSKATRSTLDANSMPPTPIDDPSSFIAPLTPTTSAVSSTFEQELDQVTGTPTTGHWKPDSTASCCTSPICSVVFTLFSRRHHCRKCGNIFCASHSAYSVPLDQDARFHPKGHMARSCDNCAEDYGRWQHERKSRASSIASGHTAIAAATPTHMPLPGGNDEEIRGADYLGVEPRAKRPNAFGGESVRDADWNWSTF